MSTPVYSQFCSTLTKGPQATVVSVRDGDTIDLSDGQVVRLIGIQAPKLPLGRDGYPSWPLGEEARIYLENISLGHTIQLYYGTTRKDRHARTLAHVVVVDTDTEIWLQQRMISQGMARVYSFYDNRLCLEPLLASERQARVDRLGIWKNNFYKILQSTKLSSFENLENTYQLVEGRVTSVAANSNRAYVNFSDDWNNDFTVIVPTIGLKNFKRDDLDITNLHDKLIRVRGWIETNNGPMITVSHPEQIEILGAL